MRCYGWLRTHPLTLPSHPHAGRESEVYRNCRQVHSKEIQWYKAQVLSQEFALTLTGPHFRQRCSFIHQPYILKHVASYFQYSKTIVSSPIYSSFWLKSISTSYCEVTSLLPCFLTKAGTSYLKYREHTFQAFIALAWVNKWINVHHNEWGWEVHVFKFN